MSSTELDDRGVLMRCPKCGQRNRLHYGRLGETGRCGKCGNELKGAAEPIDVLSDSAFDTLTSQAVLPVLVDFWAPWCGPCKMVAPELTKVAREGAGKWLVAKVNTENLQNLARRFRINAIPTMVLFNDGIEVARRVGAMAAPAIRKFLQPWIEAR